jgi:crotonobetainyl-CoA:carnitine CoA-transferase CaiB-like acyl-CoA transferase
LLQPSGEPEQGRRVVRLPVEERGADLRWPPSLGADTEAVLRAAGVDEETIRRLLDRVAS